MGIVLQIRERIHSLSGHLLITYVTVMLLGLGSVIGWTGQQLAAETVLQAQDQLELQAQIIANALREPAARGGTTGTGQDTRTVPDLLASYAENIGGRVSLVDAQMNLMVSSDPQAKPGSLAGLAEFSPTHYAIRRDAPNAAEWLYVATPIPSNPSHPLGFVQLAVPMERIYGTINRKWLDLAGIGGVALAITIVASLLLARRIATPVQQLTATSEQIASGQLQQRASPAGPGEVQRLGHAFNQMAERVQVMLAQQRQFVDNAAHELRSPLTSLRLRLDLLADDESNDPVLTKTYVGKMQHDVGYLQHLVDHLLTLASAEEGEPAERTPTDLAPVLCEICDEMGLIVQQAGLSLQVTVPEALPCVQANADQIRIAVHNLLDNAVKYSRPGGTVSLLARVDGHMLEIEIADNGIGIPAEALPHIFERFYRADRARARKQGGAGLGLALVRAMVQANGGTIAVDSRVNQGSRFTVRFPVPAAAAQVTGS